MTKRVAPRSNSSETPPAQESSTDEIVAEQKMTWLEAATRAAFGAALAGTATGALADEGGVSFWLPGQMGSLAAVPGEPGWSLPTLYLHSRSEAGGDKALPIGGRIVVGIDATLDLLAMFPTYTFAQPVVGGQASLGVGIVGGRLDASVSATLTGPRGGIISGAENDTLVAMGDLYPTASLKWNHGVHNTMAYAMLGVPVGSYRKGRLANLGTNHWSVDAGGGYTYFDPKHGLEASAVLGFTYNFENDDTNYRNGNDLHLDWATSYFEGLQGVRREESTRGLEPLVHARRAAGEVTGRTSSRTKRSAGNQESAPNRIGPMGNRRSAGPIPCWKATRRTGDFEEID